MATLTRDEAATIFYKDWGSGQPIVFSHGWPLDADAWDTQLWFMASHGFRAIAHDRRGHGRSSQTWTGNDMDGYADDLAALLDTLDVRDAILVGHSTGGGEVARYLGRHGARRVSKLVLISAVTPLMLRTANNPAGTPIATFDGLRAGLLADRSQFYRDLSAPFYGANRPGAKVSQGLRDQFWLISMQASLEAAYDSIRAFSETDLTADVQRIDVPALIVHGDDDQIVPIEASARATARLIKHAALKVYPGAPHGLTATHQDRLNSDLLEFIKH